MIHVQMCINVCMLVCESQRDRYIDRIRDEFWDYKIEFQGRE